MSSSARDARAVPPGADAHASVASDAHASVASDAAGLAERPGYDPLFLGHPVPVPSAGEWAEDAVELAYRYFTVALSRRRRLARWVAWNIDVDSLRESDSVPRSGLAFRFDPRVGESEQVGDAVYRSNRLDRGHLARRGDLLWGPDELCRQANADSFFFPNISPQMDTFNQSGQDGIWGLIENSLQEYLRGSSLPRACVLGGPVLAADDPEYRGVQVPLEFWKVLVYPSGGAGPDGGAGPGGATPMPLRLRAFLVTQSLSGLGRSALAEDYQTYGVPLTAVERRTGLVFDAALHGIDTAGAEGVRPQAERVERASQIRW